MINLWDSELDGRAAAADLTELLAVARTLWLQQHPHHQPEAEVSLIPKPKNIISESIKAGAKV